MARSTRPWIRDSLRSYPFAGLGLPLANMELSHRAELTRTATGFDQESIATLILSGRFLGFLPDHHAEAFRTHRPACRPCSPTSSITSASS